MAAKSVTTEKKTTRSKAPVSLEVKVLDAAGKEGTSMTLPEEVFGLPWNADLVHQVVVSMQSNARTPVAHTKDRGEVRGGGKKPWQQKGTGRARHGSRRSPIWVGGGVTHGPRNDKDYSKKVNRKMSTKALFVVLSRKFRDGEVVFVDSLGLTEPKTAAAKASLVALEGAGFAGLMGRTRNAALVVVPQQSDVMNKSFSNLGNVALQDVRSLNPVDVLGYKYLVVTDPSASLETLKKRAAAKVKSV